MLMPDRPDISEAVADRIDYLRTCLTWVPANHAKAAHANLTFLTERIEELERERDEHNAELQWLRDREGQLVLPENYKAMRERAESAEAKLREAEQSFEAIRKLNGAVSGSDDETADALIDAVSIARKALDKIEEGQ
jgi:hypothetical protein